MRWDDLRFFLAVAESKTLAGAARRLDVNHSTVFRRLNEFEDDVGARLFERLPDGYQLTVAGEELLEHAERVGREIDAIELKVLGKDYRPRGTVRLTAPERIANTFLPPYLAEFASRYPEIRLELNVSATSLDLTRREADVAIRATTSPPPHLIGRRMLSLPWSYYATQGYIARHGRLASIEALSRHALIGADGALRRLSPFRALDAAAESAIVMRCSTLNTMAAMAAAGIGQALLPRDQERPALVRQIDADPAFYSELWLLTHPELKATERIRLVTDHLFDAFREDPLFERYV